MSQRKFALIVTYVKDMLENGMRQQYLEEDEDSIEYWNELVRQFKGTYEMDFVSEELYGKNKQKLKEYIVVLLHTRKLFSFFEDVEKQLKYMYTSPEKKFEEDLEPIRFLRDGEFGITSENIRQFDAYSQERYEREELDKKQRLKEKLEQERREREQRE